MRIANNSISAMRNYYFNELKDSQSNAEIETLFAMALEHYLKIPRAEQINKGEEKLNQSDILKIYDCCKAIKKNVPIQYVLGETWFLGLKFFVNPDVLIPRPETEELTDLILRENPNARSFLDIGTGSACIPVSIKAKLPTAKVYACDISEKALAVAKRNASNCGTEIHFFLSNVLDQKEVLAQCPNNLDVIVSNPPYILASEKQHMDKQVLEQEPHLALFVDGNDPIVFYKKIIDLSIQKLAKDGSLYFELNPLTANQVKEHALQSKRFSTVDLIKDMSGKWRFIRARK